MTNSKIIIKKMVSDSYAGCEYLHSSLGFGKANGELRLEKRLSDRSIISCKSREFSIRSVLEVCCCRGMAVKECISPTLSNSSEWM